MAESTGGIVKRIKDARERLRVQLMPTSRFTGYPIEPIGEIGPHGTMVALAQEHYPLITYPTKTDLKHWEMTQEEAIATGKANLRRQFAFRRGLVQMHGPLRATFYDNDVPGFAATRLLFPDLICRPPDLNARAFVCAFDRDLLVVVETTANEDAAALHLLYQVKLQREGYPQPLLPNTPLSMLPDGRLVAVEFKRPNAGLLVPLH